MRRLLASLALLLLGSQAPVASVPATVLARFPHDPAAFTEGLFYRDGLLFESTGEPGRSSIRRVALATGRVLRRVDIPAPTFGEGIAPAGRQIVSLTWHGQTGYRWTIDTLRRVGTWHYPGEGWALTGDGHDLIMSDGTDQLRFLDPRTLRERRRLAVTYDGAPLGQLNELEYVDGEVLANIWLTSLIARIDPASGHVVGLIDLAALTAEVHPTDPGAVANGIAWDAVHRRLFVTGKYWPVMFQIAPPHGR